MEFFEAVEQRHSTRKFDGTPVRRDLLDLLVNAGRLAPTARNEQPWEFVVVTDRRRLEDLAALTDHGKFIAQAGACIAVLCKPSKYYLEDGSAATENLLLAAAAVGLQSCWVAGEKKEYAPRVARFLGAPDSLKLVSLVAVGRGADSAPPAKKRELAQVRHWEQFGSGTEVNG